MSFDDEVDALKASLAGERGGVEVKRKHEALIALAHSLRARIASRRVEFELDPAEEDEEEPSLLLIHSETGEELGSVFFENESFSFESEDDDYFPDLDSIKDQEAFAAALYEVLKVGLPVYELDVEADRE